MIKPFPHNAEQQKGQTHMKAYTKELIKTILYADETIDNGIIQSVVKILESCDKRTTENVRNEVLNHIKQFTTNERRIFSEIEAEVKRLWRIEPEVAFNPTALQALTDFANNPGIIGVSVFDKGGKKQYYFNANEK